MRFEFLIWSKRMPPTSATRRTMLSPILVALASAALLAACNRTVEPPPPEIRPVRSMTVDKRGEGQTISLTGNVQAQTEVNLAFRIDGRLVERLVNVGDAVKPGQIVARLDPENEESALQAVQAQLVGAQARLVEARNQYARFKGLVAENAISRSAFDQSEANFRSAESQVESAQAQVALSQNRLSYTRLVSDVAGTVTAQGAEPGEIIGAGRMIVQVAKQGGRDAVFDVPAQVKDSTPANVEVTVALTSDPNVSAVGRVREVSPRADPVTGTFRVRVGLTNPPAALRLGSTVTGRVHLAAGPSIRIPASALVRSDRQASVWIVEPKTQTVAPRVVEVGSYDPGLVVITAGLQPGDVIVTAGVQALRPGQKVRLLEAAK
ncbi:MAG: efflux RND transporter periplasmic adaptor subunit [Burkholderiales bacterium]